MLGTLLQPLIENKVTDIRVALHLRLTMPEWYIQTRHHVRPEEVTRRFRMFSPPTARWQDGVLRVTCMHLRSHYRMQDALQIGCAASREEETEMTEMVPLPSTRGQDEGNSKLDFSFTFANLNFFLLLHYIL